MSQVFSAIGSGVSKIGSMGGGKLLPGIGTGLGFLQNWLASRKQNHIYDTLTNPNKMNALVSAYEKPLSGGLTKSVDNTSQAFLAERGLGDSPTIAREVEAQAMAPFVQQNQQQAIQMALQSLGLAQGSIPKGVDMTGLLKLLMTPKAGGGGFSDPGNAPDPTNADMGPNLIPEDGASGTGQDSMTLDSIMKMFSGNPGGGLPATS